MTTATTGWTRTRRLGRSGIEVSAVGLGGAIGGAMATRWGTPARTTTKRAPPSAEVSSSA
jgi:aryl-alcohol dehydrogenase-like predicted oxidoreductase